MKSFLFTSTFINAAGAFTIGHNHGARIKLSQISSTAADIQEESNKPIVDPLGLYPKNSSEKEGAVLLKEDSEVICDERKVRDPMGLYPDGFMKGKSFEEEVLDTSNNPIHDPLGLYPKTLLKEPRES